MKRTHKTRRTHIPLGESNTSLLNSMAAVAKLGALVLTNRCIEKIEKHRSHKPDDEAKIQRQLTVLSIVYHAIGIFYNE